MRNKRSVLENNNIHMKRREIKEKLSMFCKFDHIFFGDFLSFLPINATLPPPPPYCCTCTFSLVRTNGGAIFLLPAAFASRCKDADEAEPPLAAARASICRSISTSPGH